MSDKIAYSEYTELYPETVIIRKEGFFYNDWTKEPGVAISSCNDGFRPVIFKLEATDIPSEK